LKEMMMAKEYKARNGTTQIMPSAEELADCDDDGCGWCLACGFDGTPAEPDAVRYKCEGCGAEKVYGAAELALRDLFYV
jgi:hypothetical protein